jgi:hypothetical protein
LVDVGVGETTGVFVGVKVGVTVGVFVGVLVGVTVGVLVGVLVGVFVGVLVGVFVGVLVGVLVGVNVGVNVGVFVGVAVATSIFTDPSTGATGTDAPTVLPALGATTSSKKTSAMYVAGGLPHVKFKLATAPSTRVGGGAPNPNHEQSMLPSANEHEPNIGGTCSAVAEEKVR